MPWETEHSHDHAGDHVLPAVRHYTTFNKKCKRRPLWPAPECRRAYRLRRDRRAVMLGPQTHPKTRES